MKPFLSQFLSPFLSMVLAVNLLLVTAAPLQAGEILASQDPNILPPLVDTTQNKALKESPKSPPTVTPLAPKMTEAQKAQAETYLKEQLKPAMPFIEHVEASLFRGADATKQRKAMALNDRLDSIQQVVFGARTYNNLQVLLVKLAEVFPGEAAQYMPPEVFQKAFGGNNFRQAAPPPQLQNTARQSMPPQHGFQQQPQQNFQQPQQNFQQPQQAPTFSQSDNDFFRDEKPSTGSKLRSLAQGALNLAMVGGALAGSYFLNRNLGSNADRTYNDPYYGMPGYSYGGYSPGYGYGQPYGYGLPGALGYGNSLPGTMSYRNGLPGSNPYGYGSLWQQPQGYYRSGYGSNLYGRPFGSLIR